jgi:hypothetical protein
MFHRNGNTVFIHAGLSFGCLMSSKTGNTGGRFGDLDAIHEEGFAEFTGQHPLDVDKNECHPLWIRHESLGLFDHLAKGPMLVHGHTPAGTDARLMGRPYSGAQDIGVIGRRLNLDAGSYQTLEVAGAIIQAGRYRTIHASTARSERQ